MTQAVITSIPASATDAELEDWGPLGEATGDPMAGKLPKSVSAT